MPGDYTYYDPNDPNMGSQTDASQQESANDYIYSSFARSAQASRAYQSFLASRGGSLSDDDRRQAEAILRSEGLTVPPGMEVTSDGRVLPIDKTTRNRIITGLMAAPLLLPGSGGAATGAAGAGGNAGLAGSGYVVPSAALGAGGGVTSAAGYGGMAGLAGSDYVVPSAALGANGGVGAGVAGTAGAATSAASRGAWSRVGDAFKVAAKAAPLAAAVATRPNGGANGSGSMSPELQQLLAQALKRMSSQDGLFNAVNAQAMAGLPTIYQR